MEGPENGVYYRGQARLHEDGAEICLPEFFESLTRPDGRTVLLTPIHDGKETLSMLSASEVVGGRFQVRSIDGANPSQRLWWEVKAIRADVEPLEVEPSKPVADVTGQPARKERVKAVH